MSLANLREPATLVLSPTLVKLLLSRSTVTVSSPHTVSLLSTETPLFVDKLRVSDELSTETPLFVDKLRVSDELSTEIPLFVDKLRVSDELRVSDDKSVIVGEARESAFRERGARPETAPAMARMCSGVVPQQPPTTFTRPRDAISRTCAAISAGLWSYPPSSLGSPALG